MLKKVIIFTFKNSFLFLYLIIGLTLEIVGFNEDFSIYIKNIGLMNLIFVLFSVFLFIIARKSSFGKSCNISNNTTKRNWDILFLSLVLVIDFVFIFFQNNFNSIFHDSFIGGTLNICSINISYRVFLRSFYILVISLFFLSYRHKSRIKIIHRPNKYDYIFLLIYFTLFIIIPLVLLFLFKDATIGIDYNPFGKDSNILELLVTLSYILIFGPIIEELVNSYIATNILSCYFNPIFTALLSAGIFSLMHIFIIQNYREDGFVIIATILISRFFKRIVFSYYYVNSKNLLFMIIMHILNNSSGYLFLFIKNMI